MSVYKVQFLGKTNNILSATTVQVTYSHQAIREAFVKLQDSFGDDYVVRIESLAETIKVKKMV